MKVKLRKINQDRESYKKYLETFDNKTLRAHQEYLRSEVDRKYGWFNEDKGHTLSSTDFDILELLHTPVVDISMIISDRKAKK